MAKKDIYFDTAEHLYVIDQHTLNEIASRLSVSERTLVNWKAQGEWDEKRKQYLASRQSFHEELYLLARDIAASVRADIREGKKVDAGRLYTLTRLIPNLLKAKDYEDAAVHDKEKSGGGLDEEVIKVIEEEILGIRRKAGNA